MIGIWKLDNFTFELVSPSSLVLSDQVDMVVVPGKEGYFGVLSKHMPMISDLRPGILNVSKDNNLVKSYFIEGGVAEINEKSCTVLADKILDKEEVSREKLLGLEEKLLSEIDSSKDDNYKKSAALRLASLREFSRLID